MRYLVLLAAAISMSGCQSFGNLTPAQQAALFCVVSGGVVQAAATTKTVAGQLASQYTGAQVVLCNTATQVGTVLTK